MNEIIGLSPPTPSTTTQTSPSQKVGTSFNQYLTEMIDETNSKLQVADKAAMDFHTGKVKNLHEVMIAMEEANISTRFVVQVRNKMIEAYQEVLRIQL
ncbi:MAG: flagellar hook-basal body complex protein FliE [Desulfobulbaceae bacterium]|nr:flagellar hook-basal body complex protein FliE [Desulfobulbaceae bacterium]